MTQLRIISDIHGKRKIYLDRLDGIPYSFQVGDLDVLGFDWMTKAGVEPEKHKFIGGNHDNYNLINESSHCLGDYGVWSVPDFGDVFFMRGGFSLDKKMRTPGKDWWPEEELTQEECEAALEFYKQVKPKLVISHECPLDIVQFVSDPMVTHNLGYRSSIIHTRTNMILQRMREYHAPKMHVFGHYHKNVDIPAHGVRYVCLSEFGFLDLPKNFVDSL